MQCFKATLAALMCISLIGPSAPGFAETAPSPGNQSPNRASRRPAYRSGQLHGDERILHALNRLTFGPRAGDLDAVRAIGLDQWFNQQLHPERLDQSDLNARLAQFPAMRLATQDLLFRYPSNAIIRQVVDGKATIPKNPALQAIYSDELARVEQRRQEKDKQNQQQTSIPAPGAMTPGGMSSGARTATAPMTPQEMAESMIESPAEPQTAMASGSMAKTAPKP